MTYTYKYPRPAVTVDAVVLSRGLADWQVLLIKRKHEPYKNMWALPGGFVDQNEDPDQAVHRELEEETSLTNVHLQQLGFWGRPGRDPRGHTVSLVYWGTVDENSVTPVAADDAADIGWHPVNQLPPLAFDHTTVIASGITKLTPLQK